MCQRTFVSMLFIIVIFTSGAYGQSAPVTVKDKYQAVQVDQFDIQKGVQIPPKYLPAMQEAIINKLQQSKQFKEVLRPGEKPPAAAAAVLRLTGTVTHFKGGSQTTRSLFGPGLAGLLGGSTEIFAHVALLDQATGQIIFTEDVQGGWGTGGVVLLNATRDFAEKLVTSMKLVLLQRLPPAGTLVAVPPASIPARTADRLVITISAKDYAASELKLNSKGSAGYRVVDFRTRGWKAAAVTLEKSCNSKETYQYLVLHAHKPGTLRKNLNKAAKDGYRVCPHAAALLGGHLAPQIAVVAFKPSSPPPSQFEYRVHRAILLSSARKDIARDEREGFLLVETMEGPGGGPHVVVMERQKESR